MPIDPERLQHGRAVISRGLGGARLALSVDSLVASLAEAFALDRAKPAEAWPDYVAQALAEVDSDLERLASAKAELAACQAQRDAAKAEAERVRSSAAYQAETIGKLEAELNDCKAELGKARRDILDGQRARDRAQARANNESIRADAATRDSLLFAAESDERGELLAELVAILAAMPLESFWQWPDLAATYGKARRLGEEWPADRLARLGRKLEGSANG